MKRYLISLLMVLGVCFLVPSASNAQMPGQLCTTTGASAASLKRCGVEAGVNTLVRVTDGLLAASPAACTGGTDEMVCFCEGTTCVPAADDAGLGSLGDCITLSGNDDQLCNDVGDSVFTFNIDEDGTVIIDAGDTTDANTPLTLRSGGTGLLTIDPEGVAAIYLGSANVTDVAVDTDGLDVGIDAALNTLTLTAATTGVVTILAADAAAPASMLIDTTTTGSIDIGSADVLDITLTSDGDVQQHAGATGSVIYEFYDDADAAAANSAHGVFEVNLENAGDGTEEAFLEIHLASDVNAGLGGGDSAPVERFKIWSANGQQDMISNTVVIYGMYTGSNQLQFTDFDAGDRFGIANDADANAEVGVECTTVTTGAEDCDLTLSVQEAGTMEARITIDADGDIDVGTALNDAVNLVTDEGIVTVDGGITLPDEATGGNGDGLTDNRQHQLVGIPRIVGYSAGQGNDGSETTNVDFGDDETPNGEWTQTANIVTADEGTVIKMGTGSLSLTVGATPADGNGADCDLVGATGAQDWTDDASFGMWMRCDELTDATMWVLEITDNPGGVTELAIPAVPVADHWTWVEVDHSGLANNMKDVIDSIAIDLTGPGAAAMDTQICYFDYMWEWDDAEELAMNVDVYEDGVLSVFSMITATANNRIPIVEVEGTDYFIHYEAGDDFIVPVSDLSADSLWGMAAIE